MAWWARCSLGVVFCPPWSIVLESGWFSLVGHINGISSDLVLKVVDCNVIPVPWNSLLLLWFEPQDPCPLPTFGVFLWVSPLKVIEPEHFHFASRKTSLYHRPYKILFSRFDFTHHLHLGMACDSQSRQRKDSGGGSLRLHHQRFFSLF